MSSVCVCVYKHYFQLLFQTRWVGICKRRAVSLSALLSAVRWTGAVSVGANQISHCARYGILLVIIVSIIFREKVLWWVGLFLFLRRRRNWGVGFRRQWCDRERRNAPQPEKTCSPGGGWKKWSRSLLSIPMYVAVCSVLKRALVAVWGGLAARD